MLKPDTLLGLVTTQHSPSTFRPLVTIGFTGFGDGFAVVDNYFVRMLALAFDLLLAADDQSHLDLLFYRHPLQDAVTLPHEDEGHTLKTKSVMKVRDQARGEISDTKRTTDG